MNVYKTSLDSAFEEISHFPEIGIKRNSISPGRRSRRAREHIVFYENLANSIIVRRILHIKRDIAHVEEW